MSRPIIDNIKFSKLLVLFITSLFVFTTIGETALETFSNAVGLQFQGRSITMSTSNPGATATYTVGFTPQTNETHPDVIIDFCNISSDPIVGDTCSGTAGTDVPNVSSVVSACATGWTCTSIDSNHGLYLTTTTLSFTSGTGVTIAIPNIVNMTNVATSGSPTAGSFYGRLLDYATGGGSGKTSASPGSYVDYGGIALSTATPINITAKVYETIDFCVFETTCGTAPVLTLGSPNLSSSTAYVNSNAEFTLGTNASQGVVVYMTGNTLCRSTTQSNCNTGSLTGYTIESIGEAGTETSPATSSAGTPQFGMCVDSNSLPTGVSVVAPYIDTSSTKCHSLTTGTYSGSSLFGLDDSTSAGGTNSAGGSEILSSTGPFASYTDDTAFLANISNLTPAGVYTTNLYLTATGTF